MPQTNIKDLIAVCQELIRVLPSSTYWEKLDNDETWDFCWNELSGKAQDRVVEARIKAQKLLAD